MRTLILSLLVVSSITAHATENVVPKSEWSAKSLRQALESRPTGDPLRGKDLNTQHMCASCHGKEGIAPTPNWPSVAGQLESYTFKMLLDYQSGARNEDNRANIMTAVVDMLSPQDMSDLASYYASLAAPDMSTTMPPPALVTKGDPQRLITPCASCHGLTGQGGIKGTPAIAGQSADTLKRALVFYQSGERQSDLYSVMRQATKRLTADEIDQLGDYYSAQN